MAMAFRPQPSPCSIRSRNGSHSLVARSRLRVGGEIGWPKSVVTSLAGFASEGLSVTSLAAFASEGSVVTSLAGFEVTLIGRFWVTTEDSKRGLRKILSHTISSCSSSLTIRGGQERPDCASQRIVAGRRILRNLGRNNNSPATGSKTGCYQSEKGDEKRVHRGTTIISQMVGTPVFSDRTEFSVTTGYILRNLRT